MATVRGSTSSTIIALLGTLNSAANASVKTIDAATDGVDMLTSFIQKAKAEQKLSHQKALVDFKQDLDIEMHIASVERARKLKVIQDQLKSDPALNSLYQQQYAAYGETEKEPEA